MGEAGHGREEGERVEEGGRVVVVGDVESFAERLAALARNAGLRDAMNLAWKLSSVLRRGAGDDLLDTTPRQLFIAEQILEQIGWVSFPEASVKYGPGGRRRRRAAGVQQLGGGLWT